MANPETFSTVSLNKECKGCKEVFQTYDKTKLFHSNKCQQAYSMVHNKRKGKERDNEV